MVRKGNVLEELPAVDVLFARFLQDSGSYGAARERFQQLVTDLVSVNVPRASEVALPSGSDWGIDTYVGALDRDIVVWQSKFFPSWGDAQQSQVRASFNEVVAKASDKGFEVSAWTLCVPSILPPESQQWFDKWARKVASKHQGMVVQLNNGGQLRRQLMQPEARWVRDQYFPKAGVPRPRALLQVASDLTPLERALFVRQLHEAGYVETDAAKGYFFAAEAMARDVIARGVAAERDALSEIELEILASWESAFNLVLPSASEGGRLAGLLEGVMAEAAAMSADPDLPLRPAHRRGIAHRIVERKAAGWVAHWRDVAESHVGPATDEVLAEVIGGDGGTH